MEKVSLAPMEVQECLHLVVSYISLLLSSPHHLAPYFSSRSISSLLLFLSPNKYQTGTLRVGELSPTSGPVRHVMKVFYSFCFISLMTLNPLCSFSFCFVCCLLIFFILIFYLPSLCYTSDEFAGEEVVLGKKLF